MNRARRSGSIDTTAALYSIFGGLAAFAILIVAVEFGKATLAHLQGVL